MADLMNVVMSMAAETWQVLVAGLVAMALKIIGALLISALLIIPAASARHFAASPEAMAIYAALTGALAAIGGLLASLWLDTPSGPSIVIMAGLLFFASLLLQHFRR